MKVSRFLFLVCVALGVILPVRHWVVEPIYIASASMEPTLPVGTRLFADKLTLRFRAVRPGELIVFGSPTEDKEMVKRVIAVPGQTVELRDKKVFINGQALDEPYVEYKRAGERLKGDNIGPLLVPPNCQFVLGDNRDESDDSSVWEDSEGERIYFLRFKSVHGLVRGIY